MPSPAPLPRDDLARLMQSARLWRGLDMAPVPALSTGFEALDRRLPGQGWPVGAMTEILMAPCAGIGELSLLMPALRALSQQRPVAIVTPPHIPYGPALAHAGVDLPKVHWIDTARDTDARWSAEQMLREGSAGAVLLWTRTLDHRALRRLQLAAEAGGNHAFVYRAPEVLAHASPAAVRIALSAAHGGVRVNIVKARGGQCATVTVPLQWICA